VHSVLPELNQEQVQCTLRMMVQFYGSVLENVEFQWLISNETQENSNGQKDTSKRFSLVADPVDEEKAGNTFSCLIFHFFSLFLILCSKQQILNIVSLIEN
jgi:hypothetical protein